MRSERVKSLGAAALIAGLAWFLFGAVAQVDGPIGGGLIVALMFYGFFGGPILAAAGAILIASSERRQTPGEWVGWAFIISGLGWGIITLGYLVWIFFRTPEVTTTGVVSALVLIAIGIGILRWERSAEERVVAP